MRLSQQQPVVDVAAATGRDRHQVLGLWMALYDWFDSEVAGPRAHVCTPSTLAGAVGADEAFWRAAESAGWLRFDSADGAALGPVHPHGFYL